ncbi:hypothetical protein IAQ61_009316 [Plenodomus lingam]|uniref:uncharacterized protein n=1 Tax=Leptosphaeria maculans TaxID=5022 RepID=UPI003316DF02|nr:hypothetical protein IAQ61_009316 [Plenodomus lingam]
MSQAKAAFIKIPTGPDGFQTYPTDPARRLADSDISIEPCVPSDAEKIAEGLYLAFPESWWDQKEPPALRPPQPIRIQRMATRLLPSLTHPHMKWIKAVLTHTHETIGIAGWMAPSNHPSVHNIFRRSAAEHYGWRERMGWSEAAVEEMWRHTDDEEWSVRFARDDETRRDVMGGERHWYLAPLVTWPGYQGRGVGRRLLGWAMEQADRTVPVTPLYLESAPSARAVYLHCGFVPVGEYNFVRRGPGVVGRGVEGGKSAEGEEDGKVEDEDKDKDEVVVERQRESDLAS